MVVRPYGTPQFVQLAATSPVWLVRAVPAVPVNESDETGTGVSPRRQ